MSNWSRDDLVVLGRVTSVYGVKGWVKILSETAPMHGILEYSPWLLINPQSQTWQSVHVATSKLHGKGLVVRFEGCQDRDFAVRYCGTEIAVPKEKLPELDDSEIYWHQLEGMKVFSRDETGQKILLGQVDHLMPTGANEVLVVKACNGSLDTRERLLPYLLDQVVKDIDLEAGEMRVDWDPEF